MTTNKYPRGEMRKYTRRKTGCFSRRGLVKAMFATEAEALAHNHGVLSAYKCPEGDHYHLRSVKK